MNLITRCATITVCLTTALASPIYASIATPASQKAFSEKMALPQNALVKQQFDAARLTPEQADALTFIYAYLPEADMADRDLDFYLANVDASLQGRREMPWGASVPDREWRHFVLPVRVNNENLDMSRPAFYAELKDRVKGLSMKDAILEINHWCHEKVTYRPSDARTSSPLSSVSQAIGRCGEESTFAVAALRAMGIPARQVYTPRWAHTDDNHAWVEVWADGQWWFLGACEPEPVLNLAWFNAPASRGMLMNTNVFGRYDGPEEVLHANPLITRINVTANYAPVHDLKVHVLDADGKPAPGAVVKFGLYNYGEYYPVATKKTDAAGNASLTTGRGDMVVWAFGDDSFNVVKADGADNGPVDIMLDKPIGFTGAMEFDIIPPAGGNNAPAVTPAQRAENNRRFAQEDSIRNAYTSTFATVESAKTLAGRLGVDAEKLALILTEARGNHKHIADYLAEATPAQRQCAIALLLNVSEKDRRDIPMEVVADHVDFTAAPAAGVDRQTYDRYVLNPRVENEGLIPYKEYLRKELAAIAPEVTTPGNLMLWTARNIRISDEPRSVSLRMSPKAVWQRRLTNPLSRNIFFVAAARSLGMPARIEPVTGKTQYLENGQWHDVAFDNEASEPAHPAALTGSLALDFTPGKYVVDPKYYSSFSISKIDGTNVRQLEYDETDTYTSRFASPVALDAGHYVLTTGQRLANGGVLARSEFFNIAPGQTTRLPLVIRQDSTELSVIGSLDAEKLYRDIDLGSDKSLLSTAGRGYYVVGLIQPNHEPSAHTLNDISAMAADLEAAGRKIVLLFPDADSASRFNRASFAKLPANVVFGIDTDGAIKKEIEESLHLAGEEMPLFVVADSFNRIVYVSAGYTIGLGETLLRILRSLE